VFDEQDRWLLENREGIRTKIQRGIDQLDRGEGIPEDQLMDYLAKLKATASGSLLTIANKKR
jgi:hypothetical protein